MATLLSSTPDATLSRPRAALLGGALALVMFGLSCSEHPAAPRVPTQLVLTTNAAGAASGAAFAAQPVLAIRDAAGNTVTGNTSTVTMTVSGNGTVVGTATITTVSGLATFTNVGISGTAPASYTLTFSASGLTSATQSITLMVGAAATVTVAPGDASLRVTQTQQFTAVVKDASANTVDGATVTWSSSNAAVASVSTTGLVTAVTAGTATIAAMSNGKTGTATITAVPAIVGTYDFAVRFDSVSWETQDGYSTPADCPGPGYCTHVRAFSGGSLSGTMVVVDSTVDLLPGYLPPGLLASVTLQGTFCDSFDTESPVGCTHVKDVSPFQKRGSVSPSSYVYFPPDYSNSSGYIGFNVTSAGDSLYGRIRWTLTQGRSPDAHGGMYVARRRGSFPPPVFSSVAVVPSTVSINIGQTLLFTGLTTDAGGFPLTGHSVTWSSSNASVATVNSATGLATAVATGTATITATSEGKSSAAVLTVLPPPSTVDVFPSTASVPVGRSIQFTATAKDAGGNTLGGVRRFTWSSSNHNVAVPNVYTGVVNALGLGTATIRATTEGKSGAAFLTVVPSGVAAVEVLPYTALARVGQSILFSATAKDSSGNAMGGGWRGFAWSSSTESVATVGPYGSATAVAPGTATITATTEGTKGTATLEISGARACSSPTQLGCGLGLDQFSLIPAGTFQMGSNAGDPDETPVHSVTISRSFYLQKTEVTQAQWRAVMGSNPSSYNCGDDTCPVASVSWDDILAFLTTLNAQTPGVTYRLPTEAEWEYAARAGTTGETYGTLDAIAWWWSGNSNAWSNPVGGKQANAYGLYDMIGNVWEWVSDWYGSTYYSVSPAADPTGPASGDIRVCRGGSWRDGSFDARAAYRWGQRPSSRYDYFRDINGFRLVRTP